MGTHTFPWLGALHRRSEETSGPLKATGQPHRHSSNDGKSAPDTVSIRVIIGGKLRIIDIPRPQPPPSPRPGPRPGPIHTGPPPGVSTPPATPRRSAHHQSPRTGKGIVDSKIRIHTLPTPQPPPSPRPRPRPGPVPYPPPGVPTPPSSP